MGWGGTCCPSSLTFPNRPAALAQPTDKLCQKLPWLLTPAWLPKRGRGRPSSPAGCRHQAAQARHGQPGRCGGPPADVLSTTLPGRASSHPW